MELLLTSDSECRIHFEPEGADHLLGTDDMFRVEFSSPPEELEIMYHAGALSIASTGCDVRAWNREGMELRL